MRHLSAPLGAIFAAGLVLTGCATGGDEGGTSTAASIGTTTMIGDVVNDIMVCAGGTAETLMPVGADPHDYSASSQQVADMVSAELVVANGLGLEEGLEDTLESAEVDGATVMEVAPLVNPIEFAAGEHSEEGEHSDEEGEEHSEEGEHSDEEGEEHSEEGEHSDAHGSMDPHFWHDAARMAEASELIGVELAGSTGDETYTACGVQVHDDIMEADAQIRETLAVVPADQRVMITDHDAFGYFADAYDFEIAGVVIPGGSTLAEPSSRELAELVETIETEGVTTIFSNTANSTDLVDAVAAEAGTEVEVVQLYVGSLAEEGSAAETYVGMVTTNAERIATALG